VRQITWITECHSLKSLRLRNLCAETRPDEEFLYRIPERFPSIEFELTGWVELSYTTLDDFGYLHPLNTFDLKHLPRGTKCAGSIKYETAIILHDEIIDQWRQKMFQAAGFHPMFRLIIGEMKLLYVFQWKPYDPVYYIITGNKADRMCTLSSKDSTKKGRSLKHRNKDTVLTYERAKKVK
jgi:hypothetical protein